MLSPHQYGWDTSMSLSLCKTPFFLLHLKSINFTSLCSKKFLGRGLGAGESTTITCLSRSMSFLQEKNNNETLSPGQTDSQVDASRPKFAKPELAYGLTCEGWPNDTQVGLQVAKKRKFHAYHWLISLYNNRLLAINLCRLALGGQTMKNLRRLACKFELDQSQRKSTQVGGQTTCKLNASQKLGSTCVDLRVHLARALVYFSSCLSIIKLEYVNYCTVEPP